MSANLNLYIKLETLEKMVQILNNKKKSNPGPKKEIKGVELTLFISDTSNEYGQNVTAIVSQTKEEREATPPKDKFYVGNGSVFSVFGPVKKGEKPTEETEF